MATLSKPARSRRASQVATTLSSLPPSRVALSQLNATVSYPPHDALRLYASTDARDTASLTSIERQIAAVCAPFSALTSQSYSFAVLRQPQYGSHAEHCADRHAHRSRRPSPSPARTLSSCFSARAGPAAEEVFANVVAYLAVQINAQ